MRRLQRWIGPSHGPAVTVWWWVALVAAIGGTAAAAVLAPQPVLLLAGVVAFGLTWSIDHRVDVRDQAESGAWSALLALGTAGFLALCDLAWLPVILLVATGLWPAHWVRRGEATEQPAADPSSLRAPGPATRRRAEQLAHPAGRDPLRVRSMSTDQLCRAWADSRVPLKLSDHPEQVERMARLREAILDELEARDPQGVARWLSDLGDGRRVDASPLPYLSGRDRTSWRD
jgi:hypothetical protein